MNWMSHNWYHPNRIDQYKLAGIDGTVCSIQKYLSNEVNSIKGNIEQHCPNPDWVDVSNDKIENADGSKTFLVYRALRSHVWGDLTTPDKWAKRLLNSNCASLGGVLSYLHTEVVPNDMREHDDISNCMRKWDYDAIMVFNVTIKTAPHIKDKYGDMMGPYTAFDAGRCTGGPDVCDFENGLQSFAPGRQEQTGNPRHAYKNAWWYSFPQCGFCDWPTGELGCTYTYNVVGMYKIDDLVFPQMCKDCAGGHSGPCTPDSGSRNCEWWDIDIKGQKKLCAWNISMSERKF